MLQLVPLARQGHTTCPHDPVYMAHSYIYLHRDCTQAWLLKKLILKISLT